MRNKGGISMKKILSLLLCFTIFICNIVKADGINQEVANDFKKIFEEHIGRKNGYVNCFIISLNEHPDYICVIILNTNTEYKYQNSEYTFRTIQNTEYSVVMTAR